MIDSTDECCEAWESWMEEQDPNYYLQCYSGEYLVKYCLLTGWQAAWEAQHNRHPAGDKLEKDYEKLRIRLLRAANHHPESDYPAHYYAQKIDRLYLGSYAFDALLLLDKYRAQAPLRNELEALRQQLEYREPVKQDISEEVAALTRLHAKARHILDWRDEDGMILPVLNIVMELKRQLERVDQAATDLITALTMGWDVEEYVLKLQDVLPGYQQQTKG